MNKLIRFLNLYGEKNQRKNMIWNMITNLFSASQIFFLLLFVTRVLGTDSAGIFSFAFAVAALETLAIYGISDFQATDVREKYKTSHYIWLRVLISVVIMICSFFYLCLGNHTVNEICITLLIVFVRGIDSIDNVFNTMFLQQGRLECGSKISLIRQLSSSICFGAGIIATKSLTQACVCFAITSFLMLIGNIFLISPVLRDENWKLDNQVLKLAMECISLLVSSFLMIYLCNLPKYSIDFFLNRELQGIFAMLFLPVNVVNLLSAFVLRPVLAELSGAWQTLNHKVFQGIIRKQVIWISLVTLAVLIAAKPIGLPVLSLLYGVNLKIYWKEFLILLLGGGLNAFVQSFTSVITAMRYAEKILLFYILGGGIGTVMAGILTKNYGIWGSAVLYAAVQFVLLLCFAVFICFTMNQRKRKEVVSP